MMPGAVQDGIGRNPGRHMRNACRTFITYLS
jgi:hypothetical protein